MKKHNDKSIKDVISEYILHNKRVSAGYNTTKITDIWKAEMGPIISSYTDRITLHEGIMKVYLTSAPLRKELLMGKSKIVSILNESAGSEIIKDIQFH